MPTTPQPRKSLGQHFLHDPAILRRIAEEAVAQAGASALLEIGAGPGGLTQALLECEATRLLVVERDKRFLPKLNALAEKNKNLTVIHGDALRLSLASLSTEHNQEEAFSVVGNLPYNISTKLLTSWLGEIATAHQDEASLPATGFVLMFQDEVGKRILSQQGDPHYGRLSVLCDWLCDCERLFKVGRGAFTPPPKIDSVVLRLIPRPNPLHNATLATLEAITRTAFGGRRKMLRRALARLPDGAEPYLEAAGLQGDERAEEISLANFCAMARVLAERIPAP